MPLDIYCHGLLTWTSVQMHKNLLHIYTEILKNNVFTNLLNNIFGLMPTKLLQDNINKGVKSIELFSTEPSLNFGEYWTK